jgi:hypothetical protein
MVDSVGSMTMHGLANIKNADQFQSPKSKTF